MKHISFIKRNLILVFGMSVFLFAGCIKESLNPCFRLSLRAENVKGDDITNLGLVREVSLYIFDENMNYLETRQLDKDFILSRSNIELSGYSADRKLHLVAWGNLGDKTNQSITEPKNLNDLKLMLNSENGIAQSPDSLYFGSKEVMMADDGVSKEDTVVVRLKTGTITIKTEGVQNLITSQIMKSPDDLVFGMDNTLDTYDAAGIQTGSEVAYRPESIYDSAISEWRTTGTVEAGQEGKTGGMQNVFPGEDLTFSVQRGATEVQKVSKILNIETGVEETPSVAAGGRLDIIFSFDADGNLSAKMRVSPWGVVDEDIEF